MSRHNGNDSNADYQKVPQHGQVPPHAMNVQQGHAGNFNVQVSGVVELKPMTPEQQDIIKTLYCRVCVMKFLFGLLFFLLVIVILASGFSLIMLTFFRQSYVNGIATQINKDLAKFTKVGGSNSTSTNSTMSGTTGGRVTGANFASGDLWSIWFVSLLSCIFGTVQLIMMYYFLYKKNIQKKDKNGINKWNYFIFFVGSALCGGLFYLKKYNPKMGGKLLGKAKFLTSNMIIIPLFATIFVFCFFVWHFNNFTFQSALDQKCDHKFEWDWHKNCSCDYEDKQDTERHNIRDV